MIVARTIEETRAALRSVPRPLGFVPTMGALHAGHLALVEAATARCASVAASLFVNPTQFGSGEDLDTYPRDDARDLALFDTAGVDVVFAPAEGEMYPDGFATVIHVDGPLSETLEGEARATHFDGVATVVTKLLAIVGPDVLFLGEKDAQQLAVLRRLVRDLDLPVDVAGVPTVREPDGLAMSSRNAYLTPRERAAAPDLYRSLALGATAAAAPGAAPKDAIVAAAMSLATPDGPGFTIEYLAVVDADTFATERRLGPRSLLVAAVRLGTTRLIDNVSLSPSAYPAGDATRRKEERP